MNKTPVCSAECFRKRRRTNVRGWDAETNWSMLGLDRYAQCEQLIVLRHGTRQPCLLWETLGQIQRGNQDSASGGLKESRQSEHMWVACHYMVLEFIYLQLKMQSYEKKVFIRCLSIIINMCEHQKFVRKNIVSSPKTTWQHIWGLQSCIWNKVKTSGTMSSETTRPTGRLLGIMQRATFDEQQTAYQHKRSAGGGGPM